MDRQAWLAERRAAVVADYDAEAPTYDMNLYPADTQEEWVARLLGMIQAGGTVLDAPCGTGRYFPLIAGAGMRVVGVDQSAGMLAQARARNLYITVEEVSDQSIGHAFEALTARGLPAVRGEIIEGDVAGYHYYPGRDRVMAWFEAAGLDVIDEDYSAEESWGYRHFLLRAPLPVHS